MERVRVAKDRIAWASDKSKTCWQALKLKQRACTQNRRKSENFVAPLLQRRVPFCHRVPDARRRQGQHGVQCTANVLVTRFMINLVSSTEEDTFDSRIPTVVSSGQVRLRSAESFHQGSILCIEYCPRLRAHAALGVILWNPQ